MANTRKQQILQSIRQALASGYWRVGQRMPTERQLADEFACAVGTIRGVLSILEADGLVTRVQGSGTFVKRPPAGAEYPLFHLELNSGGGAPSASVIATETLACPVALPNAQHLQRLRYLSHELVALENIWVSLPRPLLPSEGQNTLYKYLHQAFGILVHHVEDRIDAAHRPDACPDQIMLPPVCGRVIRYTYNDRGDWIEYSETWFDPAICHYNARWEQPA